MFLANENFPFPSIIILRNAGYGVQSIQQDYSGISDFEVIEIAINQNQIILTYDKDYGEIINRYAILNPPPIIFFREKGNNPIFAGNTILKLLNELSFNFNAAFTVIEKNNVRQRFY